LSGKVAAVSQRAETAATGESRPQDSLTVEELSRGLAGVGLQLMVSILAENGATDTLLDSCESVEDLSSSNVSVPTILKARTLMKHIEKWKVHGVCGLEAYEK
jgi:hypothetical protein